MSLSDALERLQGVWNIVPTPFRDDGELDVVSLGTLTDFVIRSGVNGITILGVLGEAAKLSDFERTLVVETAIEQAGGRVPICVAVTAPSTHRSVGYARAAAERGAHSVMLAPPPLARPNEDAVRRHFLAVAEAVELPIVVQDHPPSSGVWLSVDLLARIADEAPSCRVVKLEEEPTPPKVSRLLAADPRLRVLGGLGGEMLLEELRRGAAGTMTGFGYPEILVDVVSRFRAGDTEGAASTFHRALPLIRLENQPLLNLPLRKYVYRRRGAIASDHVRAPAASLDEATISDLEDLLLRLDLE